MFPQLGDLPGVVDLGKFDGIEATLMALRKAVKPDLDLWLPLLSEYKLTSLPHDMLLEGTLREDLTEASPEVQAMLQAWPASAHLKHEGDRTQVALVYHATDERGRGPWVHLALFAATMVTTLAAGALMVGVDPLATHVFRLGEMEIPYPTRVNLTELVLGASFALPFMGVLLAHEMGHYVAARVNRVRATLPYFIPFPPYFSIIGTVGAFIRLKGPTIRRAILFDVGAAGQHRHGGVGHGHRAAEAGLGLGQQVERGDMGLMAAAAFLLPGHGVPAVVDGQVHQLVVGGVIAHLVQPSAVAVEQSQFRWVAVGLFAQRLYVKAARFAPQRCQALADPGGGFALQRFTQWQIAGEQVAVAGRVGLVDHLMGGQSAARGVVAHAGSPWAPSCLVLAAWSVVRGRSTRSGRDLVAAYR